MGELSEPQGDKRDSLSRGAGTRLSAAVEDRDDAVHVVLRGELDLATMGVAEEALSGVAEDGKALVLDLRQLSFLDSSGLRLILTSAEAANKAGRSMFVVKGPAQVDRVFELTGAGERLNLVDDPSSIGS